MTSEFDEITQHLNSSTAKIPWAEMQRSFAQGRALQVAVSLDLLQVAKALVEDDKNQVAPWVEAEQIATVSAEQSLAWLEADALVWAVVVPPYVLVQPVSGA